MPFLKTMARYCWINLLYNTSILCVSLHNQTYCWKACGLWYWWTTAWKEHTNASPSSSPVLHSNESSMRIRELESELKISKEVSARLHAELEQTEEKRLVMLPSHAFLWLELFICGKLSSFLNEFHCKSYTLWIYRYRLEDEVFYLKEKVRELQTQNKWREARNKTENTVVCGFFVFFHLSEYMKNYC